MSRKYPIAGIYRIINIINGRVYIGESGDLTYRMSAYKGTEQRGEKYAKRPIDQAILKYGYEYFLFAPIVTEYDDPRLKDLHFRREEEAKYIQKYRANQPAYGYNLSSKNYAGPRKMRPTGIRHKTRTKILKSNPILCYNTDDKSVCMFVGAKSAADLLGAAERSVISRALNHGVGFNNNYFYYADYDRRKKCAIDTVNDILDNLDRSNKRLIKTGPHKIKKRMRRYIAGLIRVNEWCEIMELKPINIDKVIKPLFDKYDDINYDKIINKN